MLSSRGNYTNMIRTYVFTVSSDGVMYNDCDHLPGRSSSPKQIKSSVTGRHPDCAKPTNEVRVPHQLLEVSHRAAAEVSLSWPMVGSGKLECLISPT